MTVKSGKYIPLFNLQEALVNKLGQPLSGGIVTFYKDTDRITLKPVYMLSGAPGSYNYVALTNPLTLSSAGTFKDDQGHDIVIYAYPYDDTTGNLDLYYVYVTDYKGEFQFSREAVPTIEADISQETEQDNYIFNGQFLVHNNLPASGSYEAGEIRNWITEIAPGGWIFERTNATITTNKDKVTFVRFQPIDNPSAYPRYAVRCQGLIPQAGITLKALRIYFKDVNKFASDTQKYVFAFYAKSNTASQVELKFKLIKYYGSGGSGTDIIDIDTYNINTTYALYQTAFSFGSNTTKLIGSNDDDYLELSIEFPADIPFDVSITDVLLKPGDAVVTTFPVETSEHYIYTATAGGLPIPDPNGNDLYLPIIYTRSGYQFDRSVIGSLRYTLANSPDRGELDCNGSRYDPLGYSSDYIPYSRIWGLIWNPTLSIPIFGTGSDYFTAIFSGTGNELRIDTNSPVNVPDMVDGSIPTGFTFKTIHEPGSNNYDCKAYLTSSDTFILENLRAYDVTDTFDGDNINQFISANKTNFTFEILRSHSTIVRNITKITCVIPGGGISALGGKCFCFSTYDGATQKDRYLWYRVTGSEPDPQPGGPGVRIGILVYLNGSETVAELAQKTREALNSWKMVTINTVSAGSMTAGCYFQAYSTPTNKFHVWYTIDGSGTEPVVASSVGIQVDLESTDTNTDVAEKTRVQVNKKYFAVPDFRGLILKVKDDGSGNDPDSATRWSLVPGIIGDALGTFQTSDNLSHSHMVRLSATEQMILSPVVNSGVGTYNFTTNTSPPTVHSDRIYHDRGASDSRPFNAYVKVFIKY